MSGEELVTLTSSDLRAIGVSALGHQKSILAKISAIQQASQPANSGSVSAPQKMPTESDMSSVDDGGSESGSSSVTSAANRLEVSATMGDASRSILFKKKYSLDRVLAKMEESFGFAVEIFHKNKIIDEEILWADVVAQHYSAEPLELEIKREDVNKVHKEEKSMLHGLTDACFLIVINSQSSLIFKNYSISLSRTRLEQFSFTIWRPKTFSDSHPTNSSRPTLRRLRLPKCA